MTTAKQVIEALAQFEFEGTEGSSLIAAAVLAVAIELQGIREDILDIRQELRERNE